ncbi:MAG: NRDE family protein [Flavobacterium sp.]|uniref:NRDE family protein n=1 Tax=Flavobacterium sp. TaxID=239 RepID=UPI003BD4872C
MCTVSFVHKNGKIIITSNRDEKVIRPGANEPLAYLVQNKKVVFPKDKKAGGTWYAVDEYSNVLVLLNGAEEKHTFKAGYRKSRGLIVLDLMGSNSPLEAWQSIDLEDIEPFTLVLFENQKLYQLRWNELEKCSLALDINQNHIWSSSTLYSKEIREKRAQWFHAFLETKIEVNEEELFNFHRYTEGDNSEHGLVINRNDNLKTLSITQTVIEKNKISIYYNDLIAEKKFSNVFLSLS